MAVRYILCPIVTQLDGDGSMVTAPKVHFLLDPGRGKPYEHSTAMASEAWALAVVRGVDFAPILADASCIDLLGEEIPNGTIGAYLAQTPRGKGWNTARLNAVLNRMAAKGIDTTGLTRDSSMEDLIDRVMQRLAPHFRARNTRVGS